MVRNGYMYGYKWLELVINGYNGYELGNLMVRNGYNWLENWLKSWLKMVTFWLKMVKKLVKKLVKNGYFLVKNG
jgi:hypothetical protein